MTIAASFENFLNQALLTRPLINEFGEPRALASIAQTSSHIEDNNLHISALRHQERACKVLD